MSGGSLLLSKLCPLCSRGCDMSTCACSSGCCNKIPQTRWLKQQTLISHSPGDGKSKIEVQADLVSDEDVLPGWQRAAFLQCPPWGRGKLWSIPFLIRALLPSWGSTFHISSKPNYLSKPPPPKPSHWQLDPQHRSLEGGRDTDTQSTALSIERMHEGAHAQCPACLCN